MSQGTEAKPRIQVTDRDEAPADIRALRHEKIATTHLDFVLQFLLDRWIPALPSHLQELESALTGELAENNRSSIRELLCRDAALQTHVLKDILFSVVESHKYNLPLPENWQQSPLVFIETTPLPQLKKFLQAAVDRMRAHKEASLKDPVVRALGRPLICAIVAESIASSMGVDERQAYFVALIRNLGDSLLSWNYPNMYSRARSEAHTLSGVHGVLRQGLGFTPFDLVKRLVDQWKLDPQLLEFLDDNEHPVRARRNPLPLVRCLELAELFCDATHPEGYPGLGEAWAEYGAQIVGLLGNANYRNLCFHIESVLEEHRKVAPHAFRIPSTPGGSAASSGSKANVPRPGTTHAQAPVPPELRGFFERTERASMDTALQELFGRVLPQLGFDAAALVDPTGDTTQVLYYFGALTANALEQIEHPVQRVKNAALPIAEEGSSTVGQGRALIALRIQQPGPLLALYCEYSISGLNGGTRSALVYALSLRDWLERRLKR